MEKALALLDKLNGLAEGKISPDDESLDKTIREFYFEAALRKLVPGYETYISEVINGIDCCLVLMQLNIPVQLSVIPKQSGEKEVTVINQAEHDALYKSDSYMFINNLKDDIKQICCTAEDPTIDRTKDRGLNDIDLKILTLKQKGFTDEQVGKEVFISIQAVKQRLTNLRNTYECNTTTSLISHLIIEGILKK